MCVVSGPVESIEAFEKELSEKGHECVRYRVSKAGHSWVMESILEEFKENIRWIKFKKPRIPFVSGVTGKWITAEEAMDPEYWTWHLRRTVRFADALTTLLKEPNRIFLEVSPGRGLALFLNQHPDKKSRHQVLNLVRHQKEEVSDVHYTLIQMGRLWLQGVPIDNQEFYPDRMPHRISLPTYPFEREYYKPPKNILKSAVGEVSKKPGLKKNPNIDNWFYIPLWERRPLIKSFCGVQGRFLQKEPLAAGGRSTLLFTDNSLGTQMLKRWEQEGHEIIIVTKGASFEIVNKSSFVVNPGNSQDYDTLVKHLYSQLKDKFPRQVIHLWGVEDPEADGFEEINIVDNHLSTGFYSLIYLAKAMGSLDISGDIHIDVVTCGVHEVTGQERLHPGKAAVLGPLKVIPQEYPHSNCRNIDIAWPETDRLKEKLPDQLLSEISTRSEDLITAYRNGYRWVQSAAPIGLPGPGENEKGPFLRQEGVYLLTGGLGRVGLILARHLAMSVQAKLILTGHSAFPSQQQWEQWLLSHPADDNISRKIKKVKEIEETGAEVLVFQADVSDRAQMKSVLEEAEEKFGPINGVIHCAAKVGQDMYRTIKEISDHDCKEQFKPKIYGLLVLEQLLGDRELDFCLLMSSGSSFLGGLGFTAYSAANNFMDAFIYYYKRFRPFRWLSINWEVWQTGEAVDKSSSPGMGAVGDSLAELALMPDEGAEVFDRVLSWPEALQVINSQADLPARIRQWIKLESIPKQDQPGPGEKPSKKTRPALSTSYAAPTSSLEQELVNIWQELLGYEPIGIRDNFFELGGDSLKAVIVTSKIHKALNIKISIKDFFSQPVIESLICYINSVGKSSFFSVKLVENKEYYPLSSVQKRLFVLNQREKNSTVYNIPSIMMLEGTLDRKKLDKTFRKLISRHESFRTAFILVEGEPVQRIHSEVNFEIEYYIAERKAQSAERKEERCAPGAKRFASTIKDFVRPFDLTRAPLLRVGLIHLHTPPLTGHPSQEGNDEEKYILMVDMHHSISDGTSMGILVKELMPLYQGESLPPLKLQYRDFSQWQSNETGQKGLQQQKEYWLKQLQGEIPVLNLPLDFPRPVVQSFEGRHVEFEPEVIETTALKELAGEEGTTLYMTLLSIYGILLARLSGQEDILIGAPIAGRRHADSHHVIGMFVNTLVLRINPGRKKKYRDFLRQVKEQTLAAFENQDYPFEDLVEQLGAASDTSASHNPLFDAAFIFQNIEIPEIRVPGLKLNRLPFEHEVSKFDMMLVTKEIKDTLCLAFEYNIHCLKNRWREYRI
jgi:malonyl CoA-acyl carrier protein transacylase/acyl carrier protein